MATECEWVRIEREFDAPIETVWRMWTDPALLASWYGPNGARVEVRVMDAVVGGQRHFSMSMDMPDRTMTMWFVGEYLKVEQPTQLAYTESMSNEQGDVLSPQSMGMPDGHPETTEIVVELDDSGGSTQMTMTHVGVPADSGGAGGWQQAIEKLAAVLAGRR
ncbi:MAG: SRPBCC domain-containing protein [Pseudomonadota bacterium]